jgi:hypothetical protein
VEALTFVAVTISEKEWAEGEGEMVDGGMVDGGMVDGGYAAVGRRVLEIDRSDPRTLQFHGGG